VVDVAELSSRLRAQVGSKSRYMVAIAAPPGSGKTTIVEKIRAALVASGETAVVVPMDGFHFDDIVLNARGHRARKGAPYTFDAFGFEVLLKRIKAQEPDIAIPVFDRKMELSRAAADIISADTKFILVEGNYLLLKDQPWARLKSLFDFSIYLKVPVEELERRLTKRILEHGHDAAYAKMWIASNDLLNIKYVIENSVSADLTIQN
jgi:pantothenate kinase